MSNPFAALTDTAPAQQEPAAGAFDPFAATPAEDAAPAAEAAFDPFAAAPGDAVAEPEAAFDPFSGGPEAVAAPDQEPLPGLATDTFDPFGDPAPSPAAAAPAPVDPVAPVVPLPVPDPEPSTASAPEVAPDAASEAAPEAVPEAAPQVVAVDSWDDPTTLTHAYLQSLTRATGLTREQVVEHALKTLATAHRLT